MQKKWLLGLLAVIPLAIGGLVFAQANFQTNEQIESRAAFICPLTGDELPCSKCCPLNEKKETSESTCCSSAKEKQTVQSEGAFICPLTGEELPCSKCCPLEKSE